eukprot:TRINITY_DN1363_c0_g1_i1.p1 TRINITY_DN1363_c0_g1~~TRINITY_DN1363_c0_g1_i1.p1  ORF type:complete len:745 (+),score=138.96 TRINITY_DN1363_c0_g1_i1:131-2236(+)
MDEGLCSGLVGLEGLVAGAGGRGLGEWNENGGRGAIYPFPGEVGKYGYGAAFPAGAAPGAGGAGFGKTAVAMGSSKPKTLAEKAREEALALAAIEADPKMVLCELCATGEPIDGPRAARMHPCKQCGRKFHTKCLKEWAGDRDLFDWANWVCGACRKCEVCKKAGINSSTMFCKNCDKGYHCSCTQPPLKAPPKGPFLCPEHARCHSCGTKVPGSGTSSRWFLNYMLCDACGRLFVKGKFCPVCLRVYRDTEPSPMICCDSCERWVHCSCDDISPELYDKYQSNDKLTYKCSACQGKSHRVYEMTDASQELWRRREAREAAELSAARVAAGLPPVEELKSRAPSPPDSENEDESNDEATQTPVFPASAPPKPKEARGMVTKGAKKGSATEGKEGASGRGPENNAEGRNGKGKSKRSPGDKPRVLVLHDEAEGKAEGRKAKEAMDERETKTSPGTKRRRKQVTSDGDVDQLGSGEPMNARQETSGGESGMAVPHRGREGKEKMAKHTGEGLSGGQKGGSGRADRRERDEVFYGQGSGPIQKIGKIVLNTGKRAIRESDWETASSAKKRRTEKSQDFGKHEKAEELGERLVEDAHGPHRVRKKVRVSSEGTPKLMLSASGSAGYRVEKAGQKGLRDHAEGSRRLVLTSSGVPKASGLERGLTATAERPRLVGGEHEAAGIEQGDAADRGKVKGKRTKTRLKAA